MNTTGEIKVGDAAPAFDLPDETGTRRRLADYLGKTVVLYFYPKDDTPGCTKESCGFQENLKAFKRKKAVVLGVSPDSAESHKKFKKKFSLEFPLLVDTDKSLCQAYGVWKEKTFMGRTYLGVERSTFVIGPDGKLLKAERQVQVDGHVQSMLEAV